MGNLISSNDPLNEHELEQTLGDSEGQGSLVCHLYGVSKSQTQLSD